MGLGVPACLLELPRTPTITHAGRTTTTATEAGAYDGFPEDKRPEPAALNLLQGWLGTGTNAHEHCTSSTEHAPDGGGHAHPKWLQHHFDTPNHQFETAKLGSGSSSASILMFGGLRGLHHLPRPEMEMFRRPPAPQLEARRGQHHRAALPSLTRRAGRPPVAGGRPLGTTRYIVITLLCAAFLVVKLLPVRHSSSTAPCRAVLRAPVVRRRVHRGRRRRAAPSRCTASPPASISSRFVLPMTAPRRVLVGMGILTWVLMRNLRGDFSKEYFTAVEIGALCLHLVDLVWIYLFPLLYLVG